MRKVRFLTSMVGLNFDYSVDEEADLPDDFAEALCSLPEDNPRAVYVDEIETTSMTAPEIAVNRRGRPRNYGG